MVLEGGKEWEYGEGYKEVEMICSYLKWASLKSSGDDSISKSSWVRHKDDSVSFGIISWYYLLSSIYSPRDVGRGMSKGCGYNRCGGWHSPRWVTSARHGQSSASANGTTESRERFYLSSLHDALVYKKSEEGYLLFLKRHTSTTSDSRLNFAAFTSIGVFEYERS